MWIRQQLQDAGEESKLLSLYQRKMKSVIIPIVSFVSLTTGP